MGNTSTALLLTSHIAAAAVVVCCFQFGTFLKSINLLASLLVLYRVCVCRLAAGQLKTVARWMREFVAAHPDYRKDSVINERVNYDLLMACDRISSGEEHCPDLEGSL